MLWPLWGGVNQQQLSALLEFRAFGSRWGEGETGARGVFGGVSQQLRLEKCENVSPLFVDQDIVVTYNRV